MNKIIKYFKAIWAAIKGQVHENCTYDGSRQTN